MKYRKKPVVIEAWPVRDLLRTSWQDQPQRIRDAFTKRELVILNLNPGEIKVCTLEGGMRAGPDDFLIQGIMGEFYPCKPDIFAATYEAVEG